MQKNENVRKQQLKGPQDTQSNNEIAIHFIIATLNDIYFKSKDLVNISVFITNLIFVIIFWILNSEGLVIN